MPRYAETFGIRRTSRSNDRRVLPTPMMAHIKANASATVAGDRCERRCAWPHEYFDPTGFTTNLCAFKALLKGSVTTENYSHQFCFMLFCISGPGRTFKRRELRCQESPGCIYPVYRVMSYNAVTTGKPVFSLNKTICST